MIVQSMNSTPIFRNLDAGTKRRLRMLEFTHSYTGELNSKVKSEYICNTALLEWIAFKALTTPVYDFVDSNNSLILKGEMESESNPVHAFLEEILPDFTSSKIPTNIMFSYFIIWLKSQNKKTDWSKLRFTKELKSSLKVFGWEFSTVKKRCYSSMTESDYLLIYSKYLQLGGNLNNIPILLGYDNTLTKTLLNQVTRYIYPAI